VRDVEVGRIERKCHFCFVFITGTLISVLFALNPAMCQVEPQMMTEVREMWWLVAPIEHLRSEDVVGDYEALEQ
jgi:hypothetical protein